MLHMGFCRQLKFRERISVGKCPLGRSRRRWEVSINVVVMDEGCENGRLMKLALGRVLWQVLVCQLSNLRLLLPQRSYCSFMLQASLSFAMLCLT